jgi:hypothetical protein
MVIVIEGNLADICVAGRGLNHNSITGTLAAWTLRYCPFVFCGSQREAGDFAFRFLAAQVRDIERLATAIAKDGAPLPLSSPCQTIKKPVAGILA